MPVDAGDRVKPGDLLAELDPQDARLALRAAEAAVSAAEADARLAEAEMNRYRDLLERGFISASGFELRENQYALAKARHRSLPSDLLLLELFITNEHELLGPLGYGLVTLHAATSLSLIHI